MMAGGGTSGGGGGGGEGGTDAEDQLSFADDIYPFLVMKCAGSDCHGTGDAVRPEHASDDVEVAYEATQGMSLAYGGPIHERMVVRTRGDNPASTMPPSYADPPCSGPPGTSEGCLTEEQFDLLETWSAQGAAP
jgi:hypothetical protein